MNRSLDVLSDEFKPKVFELLARLTERGVAVMIVQTLRTLDEAEANLAAGTSKTNHSKHLPRVVRGNIVVTARNADKCDAIDLCPYSQYNLHGPNKLMWSTSDPAWKDIMEIAESLDLRSGRRWHDPVDPGHVELIISAEDRQLATLERKRVVL